MKYIALTSYTITFLLLIFSVDAYATEEPLPYTSSRDMIFDLPPKDEIDAEIVEETGKIGLKCVSGDNEYLNKDCECYTKAFVQERLKNTEIDSAWVEKKLVYVCYDEEKLLSYHQDYKNCKPPFKKEDPLAEKFCACYAEKSLLIFRNMTGLSMPALWARIKKAHKVCGDKLRSKMPNYSIGNMIRIPR